MMKKLFNIKKSSIATILGLVLGTSVSAQNARPIGMQYAGTQNYYGKNTMIMPQVQMQQKTVAPTINSVYATPMRRVNEIPLYGKNKNTYFYNEPKREEGIFSGNGLYMFASFSTGKANEGINAEKSIWNDDGNYIGGADRNDEMGTANGLTLGVGRVMSNSLSVEFMYSSYTGMEYGTFAKFEDIEYLEEEDPETGDMIEIESTYINDTTYEIIDGGGISSNFIGLGFKYNLENVFGALGGRLKPYFGFQLGIANNTIKDYTINDPDGYSFGYDYNYLLDEELEEIIATIPDSGYESESFVSELYYDGSITAIGKTTRTFGAGIEAGFTLELEGNLEIDIFYKLNMFGKVKTSGNVLSTYNSDSTEYYLVDTTDLADDANPCGEFSIGPSYPGPSGDGNYTVCYYESDTIYDVQTMNQRHVESGDMTFQQFGIKLKYMF